MQAVRSIGADRLKRFVCLLLIFVLLFCFFMCPRASAVVAEAELAYWGGAIIVSVLAAGGMALATGDAQKVGTAMYGALKDTGGKAWDSICGLASWAAAAGSKAKDAAFRVGSDVWQAIVDCFNDSYSDGVFSFTGSFSQVTPENADKFFQALNAMKLQSISFWRANGDKLTYSIAVVDGTASLNYYLNGILKKTLGGGSVAGLSEYYLAFVTVDWSSYFDICIQGVSAFTRFLEVGTYPVSIAVSLPDTIPLAPPDLVYPSDDYLVKVPDIPATDSVTGALAWPSDAVYTKDAIAVPYPVDGDGVKVPDIPYDKALDKSTGKTLDDADTDTDVKPGEDTDTKPGEDTDTDVKWPSSSDLSLPKLIISKFPFCIPFDVARLIGLLEADPKAPVFKVPIKIGSVVNEEITLDLDQYSDVIRVIRWGELIVFVAGLAFATRNYIKW